MTSQPQSIKPKLQTLVGLFHRSADELGQFSEVAADAMPPGYRSLLAHSGHMTLTLEQFHACPVQVHVLDKVVTSTHYARKILLSRQSDGQMVQFGIMRVNLGYLSPEVRDEIVSEAVPLGRVLINHNLLTRVQLFSLWQVELREELGRLLGLDSPVATFGRTALISVNDVPVVELLEIVTPLADA